RMHPFACFPPDPPSFLSLSLYLQNASVLQKSIRNRRSVTPFVFISPFAPGTRNLGSCRPSGVLVVYSRVGAGDTRVTPLTSPRREATMDFPITELMDEQACYERLVGWLHPDGMTCPRCHQPDRMVVHRRGRDPVLDFRCGHCHRVFNAFTGTALHGI